MSRFAADFGAVLHAPLVVLGEQLGLYRVLATRPMSAAELARETGTAERYVAEWLAANAASGYIEYDADTSRFRMTEEQAAALADANSPTYIPGAFLVGMAMFRDVSHIANVFRSGEGFGWHQHDHSLFVGTAKFFRANYIANLLSSWIPALTGVQEKLEAGARVADIGCGHGASTVLMAKTFPRSTFYGFDYHPESIASAQHAAEDAGVQARTSFEAAPAKAFPGKGYALVTFFDCLHDMGDPEAVLRHTLGTLESDGVCMIVEPFAHDSLADNLNSVGRIFYSASTMICTPASKADDKGLALGAQAGEARIRALAAAAGFTRFRRAAETPFNLVYEARP
ncbi:class I SAM-dependent methyltransferase [Pendulispora rubella]|uniref:Class I SAM-dependent methyltransferase n=1 Tax=Pendulispora rubella TaxID=2741070 RepID=A0ABZ2LAW1_9BACT